MKTIKIRGREISEDTIIEALKKHCGFKDREHYQVEAYGGYGARGRIVLRLPSWAIRMIKDGAQSVVLNSVYPNCSMGWDEDRFFDYDCQEDIPDFVIGKYSDKQGG